MLASRPAIDQAVALHDSALLRALVSAVTALCLEHPRWLASPSPVPGCSEMMELVLHCCKLPDLKAAECALDVVQAMHVREKQQTKCLCERVCMGVPYSRCSVKL